VAIVNDLKMRVRLLKAIPASISPLFFFGKGHFRKAFQVIISTWAALAFAAISAWSAAIAPPTRRCACLRRGNSWVFLGFKSVDGVFVTGDIQLEGLIQSLHVTAANPSLASSGFWNGFENLLKIEGFSYV
jgi:hypothetical protein